MTYSSASVLVASLVDDVDRFQLKMRAHLAIGIHHQDRVLAGGGADLNDEVFFFLERFLSSDNLDVSIDA
ncbi:MAG: hypothetical protein JO119_17780 [Acidobacteria bacterium]|nr:hypothetical protein [Acidobacteriota bacterium]